MSKTAVAQVPGAVPVVGDGVVLFWDGHEVVGVLFSGVLHAELVHTKGECDGTPVLCPQAGDKGALAIALCVQSFLNPLTSLINQN